jgi:D-lactate dehydrogenase
MAQHTREAVASWADGLPVVIDASSCAQGLREVLEGREVLDAIEWVHDRVLPQLDVRRRVGSVALHPPCSARHLGLVPKLRAIAAAMADEVVVPATATCCGMAGDRGLLHPELTRAATAPQAAELGGRHFDAHLSSNRTCELALTQGTGREYGSFVRLLDSLTTP